MLKRLILTLILTLGLALALAPPGAAIAAELSGPFEVVDAGTIAIAGQQVRLYGIRTPAPDAQCAFRQKTIPCGRVARSALLDLTAGARIRCTAVGEDGHGRTTAICRANGYDLSEGMVYTGWARAVSARYKRFEADSKARRRGLWQGEFALSDNTGQTRN